METPAELEGDLGRPRKGLRGFIAALLADQRVRFLMVGGTNTVVGFVLYSVLWLTLGHVITYFGALYGSYALASILAFFLYRRFVFHVSGNAWAMFVRFQSVYIVSLVINTLALPLLIEVLHWNPLVAQFAITFVTTMVSYVGHKFFSFRRKKLPFENDEEPVSGPE